MRIEQKKIPLFGRDTYLSTATIVSLTIFPRYRYCLFSLTIASRYHGGDCISPTQSYIQGAAEFLSTNITRGRIKCKSGEMGCESARSRFSPLPPCWSSHYVIVQENSRQPMTAGRQPWNGGYKRYRNEGRFTPLGPGFEAF